MKKTFSFILAVLCTTFIFAQKEKITQGKYKNLKGISEYNLVFEYTNLEIPKYDSEEEFLKDKMQKREEKEKGSGERFKKSWFRDREERYEPKFIESFNKRFNDHEITVGKDRPNAKYTIKVKTTMMYAGYNVGVWRQNSKIEATLIIYETKNPSNVIFSADYRKVEGYGAMGHDYDSGYRISEAYAKLAKTFAKKLRKKVL